MSAAFDRLLAELRRLHDTHAALAAFVGFPDDLRAQSRTRRHRPCADVMRDDPVLRRATHPLARAFYEAGPEADWHEPYTAADVGADFVRQFGAFCAIGARGPWTSDKMAGFVVTMPPGLFYPWHEHPADELYVVLAGEAEFLRAGMPPEVLCEGDSVYHAPGQPHARRTGAHPVMAYVTWRDHLDGAPVLSACDERVSA